MMLRKKDSGLLTAFAGNHLPLCLRSHRYVSPELFILSLQTVCTVWPFRWLQGKEATAGGDALPSEENLFVNRQGSNPHIPFDESTILRKHW